MSDDKFPPKKEKITPPTRSNSSNAPPPLTQDEAFEFIAAAIFGESDEQGKPVSRSFRYQGDDGKLHTVTTNGEPLKLDQLNPKELENAIRILFQVLKNTELSPDGKLSPELEDIKTTLKDTAAGDVTPGQASERIETIIERKQAEPMQLDPAVFKISNRQAEDFLKSAIAGDGKNPRVPYAFDKDGNVLDLVSDGEPIQKGKLTMEDIDRFRDVISNVKGEPSPFLKKLRDNIETAYPAPDPRFPDREPQISPENRDKLLDKLNATITQENKRLVMEKAKEELGNVGATMKYNNQNQNQEPPPPTPSRPGFLGGGIEGARC